MSPNIIVKNYCHYNWAMGKYIGSRKQYEKEMIAGGYVPFDKAEQMVEQAKSMNQKKYDGLSDKTMRFLNQVKSTADKKGNIKISDGFVKGLKDNGVRLNTDYDKLPKHYQGGFE